MAFSFFFRDEYPMVLAIEKLIPYINGLSHVTFWSAGCAMGQEPYSLAILLRERLDPDLFSRIRLIASDIDTDGTFGPVIRSGRYPLDFLVRIPGHIREKYFFGDPEDPRYCRISPDIMRIVEFHTHDILSLQPIRSNVHCIICKNVMLHFNNEMRSRVWEMFYESLDYGGFLLHEHTQKIPDDMNTMFTRVVSNAQLYQKI
ncbi:MAG: chemotaxis protein CheR [Methanospirillaceae archaeon]|nr:chemotaxis protein CheR [Methanospirillaceae archaeon]